MKKFLIIILILLMVILVDNIQAKLFNNSPFIKTVENYENKNIIKKEKGIFVYTYIFSNGKKETVYKWSKYNPLKEKIKDSNEYEKKEDNNMEKITNINVIINNKKYNASIEENETTQKFIDKLPQKFNMEELNGNEKYIYMDFSLPTFSTKPKQIKKGDIMLYGDDCLVIFYKTFSTNYSYTKIGHIDNLPDLGKNNIIVSFEK